MSDYALTPEELASRGPELIEHALDFARWGLSDGAVRRTYHRSQDVVISVPPGTYVIMEIYRVPALLDAPGPFNIHGSDLEWDAAKHEGGLIARHLAAFLAVLEEVAKVDYKAQGYALARRVREQTALTRKLSELTGETHAEILARYSREKAAEESAEELQS